jgi:hypothetical protein
MKVCNSFFDGGSLRARTPRNAFAENEVYAGVCYTYPPDRGVWFRTQMPTSFRSNKALRILFGVVRLVRLRFRSFCDLLGVTHSEELT